MKRVLFLAWLVAAPILVGAQPTLSIVPGEQMRADLALSSVNPGTGGADWDITIRMQDDNENAGLGSSFRRWWHVRIEGWNPGVPETVNFQVTNSGYTDIFMPVWSLDGAPYGRVGVNPTYSGGTHSFQLTVPAGVSSLNLSKYYPYTLPMYEVYRTSINTHAYVTEEQIGLSEQARPIWMYTLTNPGVPLAGKERVWIHSAVHPSENTAYFMCEGLIDWLLSGDPFAEAILSGLIIHVVPMANPDGVALGNYRTNANSVNLENMWASPYNSTVAEAQALRLKIEEFMGTSGSPGSNPIKLLLNLHATHGSSTPYHFVHTATWPSSGVIQEVRDLELTWVNLFKARSAYVNLGSNNSSSFASRVFVESMMHDRYTLNGGVDTTGSPWDPIMAITFEGVYQGGPTPGVPNTDDDYRQVGMEMGMALGDYFGIPEPSNVGEWWVLE